MTNRWTIVLMACAALTFAGCDKDKGEASDKAAAEQTDAAAADNAADASAEPASAEPGATPPEAAGAAPAAAAPATDVTADAGTSAPAAAAAGAEVTLPGGTKYVDVKVGDGEEARPGANVVVHYTGTLTDGTKFDSSRDRNEPFEFQLGGGQVIKGWDAGVAGMKVGGQRSLIIPADQAYGSRNMGVIPPNSTLLFDVELVAIK